MLRADLSVAGRLGRYHVLRKLGAGGMGVVYEAFDRERKTRVALKTLHELRPGSVVRLKHEFRVLQGLRHPNLVTLFELIEQDGHWFYTMELVSGTTYLHYVRAPCDSNDVELAATTPAFQSASPDTGAQTSRFPAERSPAPHQAPATVAGRTAVHEKRLRGALRQLAHGLLALHESGLVHRDIKPTNVLVSRAGRVVLLDFGLVTRTDASSKQEQCPAGTVEYMAPEQAGGQPVGSPADWYAVGVMLYEALTGRLPFEGEGLSILLRHALPGREGLGADLLDKVHPHFVHLPGLVHDQFRL